MSYKSGKWTLSKKFPQKCSPAPFSILHKISHLVSWDNSLIVLNNHKKLLLASNEKNKLNSTDFYIHFVCVFLKEDLLLTLLNGFL